MKVLITGTSGGIGLACTLEFLKNGHQVCGIDLKESAVPQDLKEFSSYTHFVADVAKEDALPVIDDVQILINNAGIQTPVMGISKKDFDVNILGAMNVTEKYAFQKSIKSVLFNASVSALTGNEFPSYAASKAALIGYMKNCAIRLAKDYQATCNAICFGGVQTSLNSKVMEDKALWNKIMDVTPLKRWATPQEAAQWCYFLTAVNSFCTGQAIAVNGGERDCADLFVWD